MISCLCLTYGRPSLLEEAIESFLKQETDVERELIVVNDHPEQELVCGAPNVKIVNLPIRIRTLGEKRNFAVSLARYERVLIWDDDDIYLPWRIHVSWTYLKRGHFFKCPNAWVMDHGILTGISFNLFHSGCGYSRDAFVQLGGYNAMNGGEDADFESRMRAQMRIWKDTTLRHSLLYYIYRWNHGHYHTTGVHDILSIQPRVERGRVVLNPHWEQDYTSLVQKHPLYSQGQLIDGKQH